MQNVADLKDPNDPQGRTYREVNNSTPHKYKVGQLVQLESGARLFINRLPRDCDGTPLYSLGAKSGHTVLHGYAEEALTPIKHT